MLERMQKLTAIAARLDVHRADATRAALWGYGLAMALAATAAPAYAQQQSPITPIVDIVFQIATLVVQAVVFASLAFIAIGIAKGTISAQWANTIGSAAGLSQAWTQILMTVIIGALAALSPILITMAADAIRNSGVLDTNYQVQPWQ